MTLLFDGQNAFFAERGRSFSSDLIIHLPAGSTLFFNGICYTPKDNSVLIPHSTVRQGENTLSLRMGNRLFPTEGVLFDGKAFTPAGISAEALLLRQHALIDSITERLFLLDERVSQLEKKAAARTLFS